MRRSSGQIPAAALIAAGCLLSACVRFVKPAEAQAVAQGYTTRSAVQRFIHHLVRKDGFSQEWLETTLAAARPRAAVLRAIERPYESKPWYQYRALFVTPSRIQAGVAFWTRHRRTLRHAQSVYGVPPALIIAILGVESFYGQEKGGYRVLDALTTLSFDYPPRARFFRGELEQYLRLCREQSFDPRSLMGSYAGAMGAPQFMPDSYRKYAVAFGNPGHPDIWNNWPDIIGSVANFFHAHGWQPDGLVAVPAALPSANTTPKTTDWTTVGALRRQGVVVSAGLTLDATAALVPLQRKRGIRYWVGLHDFRVITRYNESPLYAMAVYDLATGIAQAHTRQERNAHP